MKEFKGGVSPPFVFLFRSDWVENVNITDSGKQITNSRNGFLDILKIGATVLILFHHFQQDLDIRFKYINFSGDTFYFGRLVELFFMISGFLMFNYISKIENGLSFKKYIIKRVLRLMPIVIISTVVDFFISVLNSSMFSERPVNVIFETVSVALGLHGIISSNETVANNPMWYVSVLIWCYILFFFSFSFSTRLKIKMKFNHFFPPLLIIFAGMIIIQSKCDYPFANEYTGRGYVAFFAGVILGMIVNKNTLTKKWMLPVFVSVTALTIIPAFYFPGLSNWSVTSLYMIIFCFTPLILISQSEPVIKLFDKPLLGTLAKISFHAYCFHIPIKRVIINYMRYDVFKSFIFCNGLIAMIGYLVIVYIFSSLTYQFIEKPLVKWIKEKGC
ncbi:MAG: acyltransferase [Saccharofermentans sp.]|nr:acyltransferase [Saccharofermentans sp.]